MGFAFTSAGSVRVSSYSSSVAWTTSEPSTGTVQWGPVGVEPVLWDAADALGTRHVVASERSRLLDDVPRHDRGTSSAAQDDRAHGALVHDGRPRRRRCRASVRDGVLLVNGEPFFPLISWQQCPVQWQASLDVGINLFAAGSPCASPSSTLAALEGPRARRRSRRQPPVPGFLGWFYPGRGGRARAHGDVAAGAARGRSLSHDHRALRLGGRAPAVRSRHVSRARRRRRRRRLRSLSPAGALPAGPAAPGLRCAAASSRRSRRGSRPFSGSRRAACAAATRPASRSRRRRSARRAGSHSPPARTVSRSSRPTGTTFAPPVDPRHRRAYPPARACAAAARAARARRGGAWCPRLRPSLPRRRLRDRRERRHDGDSVRFTVPGLGNRTLLALGMPKTFKARGDAFTDRLGPLGVRIYVAQPSG